MALKLPKTGLTNMLKDGIKHYSGLEEAVYRNIDAAKQLAQVTKTSFGPNGMNKMLINHLDKLFITNDAATIMKELEVVHPAAKLLVLASQQQQFEVGDGTNFVVVLAGELLSKAEHLLRLGVHVADVIDGYEVAIKKALEILESLVCYEIKDFNDESQLKLAVSSAISSKQNGNEDILSTLVVKACLEVMPPNPKGFNVDNIRVVKVLGASLNDSQVVSGMVFNREPEGDIRKLLNAKVAIYSCALDISQTETKGTVLLKNADELLQFSKGEENQLEAVIKSIADSGVNCIVVGSGVGDLALHFVNRYGMMAIKILSKFDLRRLCRVTGATCLTKLQAPTKDEQGKCDVIESVEIGGDKCTIFKQNSEKSRTSTIVLRGGTLNYLDDLERAIDNGVSIIKAIVKDGRLTAGAGASEIELSRQLSDIGNQTSGLQSHAIKAFAEALEVVPRVLAENAGFNSTTILSKLYSAHQNGIVSAGVNVDDESAPVADVTAELPVAIYDTFSTKYWGMKLAADAAVTVLRVDQIIMSKPAGGPKVPKGGNQYEEDD